jgi:hypothetical protein
MPIFREHSETLKHCRGAPMSTIIGVFVVEPNQPQQILTGTWQQVNGISWDGSCLSDGLSFGCGD